MNNIMDFRQRVVMCLPYFILASLMFSPVYFLAMLALWAGMKWVCNARKSSAMTVFLVAIIANVVYQTMIFILYGTDAFRLILKEALPTSLADWLIYPSALRLLFSEVTALVVAWVGGESADDALLQHERKKSLRQFTHTHRVDTDNRTHAFAAGTTGSGKTTLLLHHIEDSIKRGEPLYILSGKNGTDDSRSLLNVTKALAAKYGRKMVVVSLNPREHDRRKYNPLAEMTPTELSDALVSISDYTEPHYKACTATWLKALCEVLQAADIPLSLASVCDFYSFKEFSALVGQMKKDGVLTAEQARGYLALSDVAEEAALSRSRYQNLLYGDGSDLFGDGTGDYVSAATAQKDGAVFFVDLDSFRYTDYTQAVGKLFIADIRHIISQERDMSTRKRVVLDELGAYATEQLMPLFAQARSYGYQIIVATQSIADLSAISETFAERVMENCGQYAVLQLNAAADAETMANIIGTKLTVETTRKSTGRLLDPDAAGTKKLVHEYKVSPDTIKELRPLTAIYYDKQHPERISLVQIPFVEV